MFDQLLILHELLIMLATDMLNSLMRMWTARLFSSRTPERLLDAHRSKGNFITEVPCPIFQFAIAFHNFDSNASAA